MPRTIETIDAELAKAVGRRINGRARIEALSACIVQDTRLIDLLLIERSETVSTTGALA